MMQNNHYDAVWWLVWLETFKNDTPMSLYGLNHATNPQMKDQIYKKTEMEIWWHEDYE
jgi:hypothetical protein